MSAPLVAATGMSFSRSLEDYPDGIIIPVDKPWRWTSADVVRKVKFAAAKHFSYKKIKVGHAGTLDPLATGVLLVCIGKATKLAEELQKHEKEYVATVVFGATTPSYDREKAPDRFFPVDGISPASVEQALKGLTGTYEQVAPLFSAKSADGVRAYEIARKLFRARGASAATPGAGLQHCGSEAGNAMQSPETGLAQTLDETALSLLTRNLVTVSEASLLEFAPLSAINVSQASGDESVASSRINVADVSGLDLPAAIIRIRCSKGTYIRAFARDLGEALGSGAFLADLRRTASGVFNAPVPFTEVLTML